MTDILNISPTRSELLIVKKKLSIAIKGHALLKKKQDALINEFFRKIDEYRLCSTSIIDQTKKSYASLSLDIAYAGIFVSRSVAYASKPHYNIRHDIKNIMGIKLPVMSAEKLENEYALHYDNSPQLAKASRRFHDLFEQLIDLTGKEIAIKKLANEIRNTKRKVNSLENIQIPRLNNTVKYINFVLEERDRESFIRLKAIKEKKS